ncbi:hypothetical protein T03_12686 [Trichinella britovi]|uniref:Uncharacterized protein n=1 Tax=Trichinella britovi TaxID=45882 RepID=A0A0V1CRH6_TRIBR|nr:hypothetical protein T03_12686 [Trichinella britovi]
MFLGCIYLTVKAVLSLTGVIYNFNIPVFSNMNITAKRNSVMTLFGSSSCSYSSASNISSVPLMKKEFSHPLMEFQNSVEQPSGSNRTMNAKYAKDPCEKYIDILILLFDLKKLLNSISYWSISCVRFLSFCKSLKLDYTSNMNCSLLLLLLLLPAFLLLDQFMRNKKVQLYTFQESSRIATNQLRSLIINASMHALNVQLKALRIGGIQLRKEAY